MALSKLRSESIDLTDDFAFTGTITGVGGGKILRVLQSVKTDTFSHATTTLTAIPDLANSNT